MRHLIHVHKTNTAGRHLAEAGAPLDSAAILVGGLTLVGALGASLLAGVLWMLVLRG